MGAKHTDGPWAFECGDHSHRYVHVTDADDRTVHYKYAAAGPNEAARDEANARLIASAPDLLEALTDCFAALTDPVVGTIYGDDPDWYRKVDDAANKARAAIARATGEAA